MSKVDVLVVTALQEEFDAARDVASGGTAGDPGVQSWEEHDEDPPPYHLGEYRLTSGGSLRFTSGAVHVIRTSSAQRARLATTFPVPGGGLSRRLGLGNLPDANRRLRHHEPAQIAFGAAG